MPLPRLLRLGLPVDPPPAAHDALYVGGRACAAHGEQPGLGLRRGHAGEGAHLGVRELSAGEGLREAWQRPEGASHSHAFAGGARIQAHPPGEPGGAGAEARVPPAAGVELAEQVEETGSGRIEVGGELSDLIAEAVQLLVVERRRVSVHGEPSFCWSDSTPRVLPLQRAREAHDLLARSQLSIQCDSKRAWESQRSAEMALLRGRGLSRRDARPKLSSENVAPLCIESNTALLLGDTRGAKLSRPCAIEDMTSQRLKRQSNVDAALSPLIRVGLHQEGHGPRQQSTRSTSYRRSRSIRATRSMKPSSPNRARPAEGTPGNRPVGSPCSSVTSPLTMVAAMPSAFCTRRRAPPGRSVSTVGIDGFTRAASNRTRSAR